MRINFLPFNSKRKILRNSKKGNKKKPKTQKIDNFTKHLLIYSNYITDCNK